MSYISDATASFASILNGLAGLGEMTPEQKHRIWCHRTAYNLTFKHLRLSGLFAEYIMLSGIAEKWLLENTVASGD